jgi:hypothetical protein
VPPGHSTPSGLQLGTWCVNRRRDRTAGRLDAARIAALDRLGFVWDPFQDAFNRGLGELAAYVRANGDRRVPKRHATPSGFKLGIWCGHQRADRRAGKLDAERVAALDALGFVWDARKTDSDQTPRLVRSGSR